MTDNFSDDSLHQQWPLDSLHIGDTIEGHVTVRIHDGTVETAKWAVVAERNDPESPDANEFGIVKAEPIYFATVEGQNEPTKDQETHPVSESVEVAGWRVGLAGEVVTGDAVIDMLDKALDDDMHAKAKAEYQGHVWVAAPLSTENIGSDQASLDYVAFTQFTNGSETVAYVDYQVVKLPDGNFVSLFEYEASADFDPDNQEIYYVGAIPKSSFNGHLKLSVFDQSSDHVEELPLDIN